MCVEYAAERAFPAEQRVEVAWCPKAAALGQLLQVPRPRPCPSWRAAHAAPLASCRCGRPVPGDGPRMTLGPDPSTVLDPLRPCRLLVRPDAHRFPARVDEIFEKGNVATTHFGGVLLPGRCCAVCAVLRPLRKTYYVIARRLWGAVFE